MRTRRGINPLPRPPGSGLGTNTGALSAAAWCVARDIIPHVAVWSVDICLEAAPAETRFSVEIFNDEWGYQFHCGDRASWIRVTDIAFVHGRDDFKLLRRTPRLENLGTLVRAFEAEHEVAFDRARPVVQSTLGGIEQITAWIATL